MTAEPQQPPEMVVIRQHRVDRVPEMSMREAARRAALLTGTSFSAPWWRVLETGIRRVKGQDFPEKANAETLARMALAVGVVPAELTDAGRPDAAAKLAKLIEAGPSQGERVVEAVRQSSDLTAEQKAYITDRLQRDAR